MTTSTMPRRKTGYALDTRVIDAVQVLAERAGKSSNQFLEKMLFDYAQLNGVISEHELPLGERRGGRREGAGKPKRQPLNSEVEASNEALVGEELPLPVGSTEPIVDVN